MKTYKTQTTETYYIHDRLVNKLHVFSSKKKFIEHMVQLCIRHYKPNGISFNDIIKEQNISGNDTTRYERYDFTCDAYGNTSYIHEVKYIIKRFTFYKSENSSNPHVINIADYLREISDTKEHYWHDKYHHNWCKEYRYKPYQIKHHFGKPNRHAMDDECLKIIRPTSRRKKGLDNLDPWHYDPSSERCWKTQTKKRHQHGNGRRDKHLESYMTLNGYDYDRYLFESDADKLLENDFMAA